MATLSKAEEQLMEHIWALGKAFSKDLVEAFPDPKPAATTVATLLKRMGDKGFVGYKVYGNSREYFPLVSKEHYLENRIDGILKNNFNDSILQFASFFTKARNLSDRELKELRKIVDNEIQKRNL